MTSGSQDPEMRLRRWHELAILLSLDVVRPFYDLMGLRLRDPEGLQRVFRRVMDDDSEESPEAVGRTIAASLGTEASRQLDWWERYIFHCDLEDNLKLEKWDTVLRHCRHEPTLWARLFRQPIQGDSLNLFRRSLDIDEFHRRQDEVDARPLSDWDLHLYALNLWDDNLYVEKSYAHIPAGPRVWVKPTVRDYQGYTFWAWVLRTLRPGQLDHLWQEGKRIVEVEELHSARGLPHPSLLDIGL